MNEKEELKAFMVEFAETFLRQTPDIQAAALEKMRRLATKGDDPLSDFWKRLIEHFKAAMEKMK